MWIWDLQWTLTVYKRLEGSLVHIEQACDSGLSLMVTGAEEIGIDETSTSVQLCRADAEKHMLSRKACNKGI